MSPQWFGRSDRPGSGFDSERGELVRVLRETAGTSSSYPQESDDPYWPITLFSILVRRRFGGADLREVTSYLAQARTREPLVNSDDRRVRAAEVVIRGELGFLDLFEPQVCDAEEFVRIMHLVAIDLVSTSGNDPDILGELLVEARQDAERVAARISARKASLVDVVADRLRQRSGIELGEWARR